MSTQALSPYDLWRTRVPEHEEAEDYDKAVKRFIDDRDHLNQIDQALELLDGLHRDAQRAGLDRDFASAADRVAEFVSYLFSDFKRTDRLISMRKAGVK